MSLLQNTSTPGFCRPIAFIIPLWISAIRGVGFPVQGTSATPLVTTAPSLFKSTNSLYSAPEPKVPEAVITGFFNSTPPIFTFIFIKVPPPYLRIQDHLYRFFYCEPENEHPPLLTCRHRPDRRRCRRPSVPPWKCSREYPVPGHRP